MYNKSNEFIEDICESIKEQANNYINEKGSFTLVLSGGRTPKDIFLELSDNYKGSIDWTKVHLFWLDERCVSPTHEDSNYKLAHDYLISKLDSIGSVHRMKGELDPVVAAKEYENDIVTFFERDDIVFDFILLGMGEDGHVASLFPNSKEVKLKDKLVISTEEKYNGHYRISLGLNLVNKSKFKLLMVTNAEKKEILDSESLNLPIHKIENIKLKVYKND